MLMSNMVEHVDLSEKDMDEMIRLLQKANEERA